MRLIFLFYLIYIGVVISRTKITVSSTIDFILISIPIVGMMMFIGGVIESNVFGLITLLSSTLILMKMLFSKIFNIGEIIGFKMSLIFSTILGIFYTVSLK